MRTFIIAAAFVFSLTAAQPADWSKEIYNFAEQLSGYDGLEVTSLREERCGGDNSLANQDLKNTQFIACVMYVLGAIDMLREWQKIDPAHATYMCPPNQGSRQPDHRYSRAHRGDCALARAAI